MYYYLLKPKRDSLRKSGQTLAPVIDLKSKKDDEDSNSNSSFGNYSSKVSYLNIYIYILFVYI